MQVLVEVQVEVQVQVQVDLCEILFECLVELDAGQFLVVMNDVRTLFNVSNFQNNLAVQPSYLTGSSVCVCGVWCLPTLQIAASHKQSD